MKNNTCLLALLACMLVAVAMASPRDRGCQYILGRCLYECPEGTHSYLSGCSAPTWSEKTCDEPEATDMGAVCDLSRCECDEPTIKDTTTGKCVKPEDCPKKKSN